MTIKKLFKQFNALEKEIIFFLINTKKSVNLDTLVQHSKITKYSRRIGMVIIGLEDKGIIHLDKNNKAINCDCTYYINNHIKDLIIGERNVTSHINDELSII